VRLQRIPETLAVHQKLLDLGLLRFQLSKQMILDYIKELKQPNNVRHYQVFQLRQKRRRRRLKPKRNLNGKMFSITKTLNQAMKDY
jgi:hypothetical protein